MARPRILKVDPRIAVVEWPAEISLAEVVDHFKEVAGLLEASNHAIACVVDVTRAKGMSASLRLQAARGLGGVAARAATRIKGVAYVAPTVVVRGVLTAIHWLAPVPFPTTIVVTRAEALRWAELRLSPYGPRASASLADG